MSKSHKKKRNTGLLYEFLVRTISSALVEDDQKKSATALKILKKFFKPDTELYKEFRLIYSLVRTNVSSDHVAASIIKEAKIAAQAYDLSALDREKSLLIRNINHTLNDDTFYDQHVNEYKIYATIQTLLNDWRSDNKDLSRVASYEDQLMHWLITPKEEVLSPTISEDSTGANRLLMKVMMKKLNEKYSRSLDDTQKAIIRAYVWSTASDDNNIINAKLTEVSDVLIKSIDEFNSTNSNEYVNEKLAEVRSKLLTEDLSSINDDTVTRFMLYIKLNNELTSGEDNA